MLDHLSIQCADVEASARFYDAVLATIGGQRIMEFGPRAEPGQVGRRGARIVRGRPAILPP